MELKHYFAIIKKKFWLVSVIVIIVCGATAFNSIMLTTPFYQANAKLIVNQTNQKDGDNVPSVGLVQANIMMINSYKEIIKSSAILKKVTAEYPDLRIQASNISVVSASNSQVMNLTYTDTSYRSAAAKINAISNVFKEQIPLIMNVDNVTILNEAEMGADYEPAPINTNPIMNIILSFVISFMLGIGIVFLLDYMDNKFKSELELEKELGLPVLGVIHRIHAKDKRQISVAPVSKKRQLGEGSYATINQ